MAWFSAVLEPICIRHCFVLILSVVYVVSAAAVVMRQFLIVNDTGCSVLLVRG